MCVRVWCDVLLFGYPFLCVGLLQRDQKEAAHVGGPFRHVPARVWWGLVWTGLPVVIPRPREEMGRRFANTKCLGRDS